MPQTRVASVEQLLSLSETRTDIDRGMVIELAGQWKHGWIPLDAIAAAIKAKKMKGDGVRRHGIPSAPAHAGKSRLDVKGAAQHAHLTAGARSKARPPRAATPSASAIEPKAAVRMKHAELAHHAANGDKVAAAEIKRREAKRAGTTPEHIKKMSTNEMRAELTGKRTTADEPVPATRNPGDASTSSTAYSATTDAHDATLAAKTSGKPDDHLEAAKRHTIAATLHDSAAAKFTNNSTVDHAQAIRLTADHRALAVQHRQVAATHRAAAATPAPKPPTPTPAPKAARKPSALHAEYRSLREEQDRRFEAHTRGGISASDTHTQEYKDYFGVGDSHGQVEPRMTYRTFLEQRRADPALKAEQQAYDAGMKLGIRHGHKGAGPNANAEYDAAAKGHADHHFASGYGDGVIAGAAKAEQAKAANPLAAAHKDRAAEHRAAGDTAAAKEHAQRAAQLNREAGKQKQVIGAMANHGEIVTVEKTNGKHRVKVDGRQHGPGHDTRDAAVAEAHSLVPEHRRAATEDAARAKHKAIEAQGEAERKAAVAARAATPTSATVTPLHQHGLDVVVHHGGVDYRRSSGGVFHSQHPTGDGSPVTSRILHNRLEGAHHAAIAKHYAKPETQAAHAAQNEAEKARKAAVADAMRSHPDAAKSGGDHTIAATNASGRPTVIAQVTHTDASAPAAVTRPVRIDAGDMRAQKARPDDHADTQYVVVKRSSGVKQGYLHMTPNADGNGNRWVVTSMPTQDSSQKFATPEAALHDHAVRVHAHTTGGIYPHAAPTADAGKVTLERNQSINMRTGHVTEGTSSASAGSAAGKAATPRYVVKYDPAAKVNRPYDTQSREFVPLDTPRHGVTISTLGGSREAVKNGAVKRLNDAHANENASSASSGTASSARIQIEHAGDGTIVHGTERTDAPALKQHGFKWSPSLKAWYLPRNWSEPARAQRVAALKSTLGDQATVVHGAVGKTNTAAERMQLRIEASHRRADLLDQRAGRAASEADSRFGRAKAIGDQIPMGQPILVGHHSEGRHRSDLAKIDTNMRKGVEAHAESQAATRGAATARANAAAQADPRAAARRLTRKEAELRSVERRLNGTGKEIHGEHTPASGGYAARLEARRAELTDEIAHDRQIAGDVLGKYGKHNVKPGDVVRIRGHLSVVHSVGPKNVKVYTSVGALPYPLTQITGHKPATDMSTQQLEQIIESERMPETYKQQARDIIAKRKAGK